MYGTSKEKCIYSSVVKFCQSNSLSITPWEDDENKDKKKKNEKKRMKEKQEKIKREEYLAKMDEWKKEILIRIKEIMKENKTKLWQNIKEKLREQRQFKRKWKSWHKTRKWLQKKIIGTFCYEEKKRRKSVKINKIYLKTRSWENEKQWNRYHNAKINKYLFLNVCQNRFWKNEKVLEGEKSNSAQCHRNCTLFALKTVYVKFLFLTVHHNHKISLRSLIDVANNTQIYFHCYKLYFTQTLNIYLVTENRRKKKQPKMQICEQEE